MEKHNDFDWFDATELQQLDNESKKQFNDSFLNFLIIASFLIGTAFGLMIGVAFQLL